jgi:hypothetical protein
MNRILLLLRVPVELLRWVVVLPHVSMLLLVVLLVLEGGQLELFFLGGLLNQELLVAIAVCPDFGLRSYRNGYLTLVEVGELGEHAVIEDIVSLFEASHDEHTLLGLDLGAITLVRPWLVLHLMHLHLLVQVGLGDLVHVVLQSSKVKYPLHLERPKPLVRFVPVEEGVLGIEWRHESRYSLECLRAHDCVEQEHLLLVSGCL